MQWNSTLPNAGFSTAPADRLYLPQDPDANRPTVTAQKDDPHSLLNFVQGLVQLRQSTPAMGTKASRRLLSVGYPLVYLRNETHLVVINPLRRATRIAVELPEGSTARHLFGNGVGVDEGTVHAGGFGCGVFELTRPEAKELRTETSHG